MYHLFEGHWRTEQGPDPEPDPNPDL